MEKKKWLFVLTALLCALTMGALAACDGNEPTPAHEHTYAETWTQGDSTHWHAATCEHTGEKKDEAAHDTAGADGACSICGYKATTPPAHEHTYAETWTQGESTHWHAATCEHTGEKKDEAAHDTAGADGACSICGYKATTPPAHVHTYAETWTQGESTHWHAATCEHTGEKKDEAAHEWDDGTVVTEASCFAAGEKKFTCTVCQKEKTEQISATGEHDYDTQSWKSDDSTHWHACMTSDCPQKQDEAAHDDSGDLGGCSVCERLPAPDTTIDGEQNTTATVTIGGGKSVRIAAKGDEYKANIYDFTYTGDATVTLSYLYKIQGLGTQKGDVTLTPQDNTFCLKFTLQCDMLLTATAETEVEISLAMAEHVVDPVLQLDTPVSLIVDNDGTEFRFTAPEAECYTVSFAGEDVVIYLATGYNAEEDLYEFDYDTPTSLPYTFTPEAGETLAFMLCAYKMDFTDASGTITVAKHEHVFDMQSWKSDDSTHWHAATCIHESEKMDEAAHDTSGDFGGCSVCERLPAPDATIDDEQNTTATVTIGGGKSVRIAATGDWFSMRSYDFTYTGDATVTLTYLYEVQGSGKQKETLTLTPQNNTFRLKFTSQCYMQLTATSETEVEISLAMALYVVDPVLQLDTPVSADVDYFEGTAFTFTATEAGSYTLTCTGDAADLFLATEDDYSYETTEHPYTFTLEAGETLAFKFCSSNSDSAASITITVTKNE